MLDREAELGELDELVERAADGRGALVLVEGPPGIGKTRLLAAARGQARRHGLAVLSARASELDREFPFGVIRQLFAPLKVCTDPARRAALLSGAAAPAEALLGGETPPPPAGADPSWAHFHALYWLVANLAEQSPAALIVDDAHWADASSLRFLQFLLPRLSELAILVAVATRAPESAAERTAIDALAIDPAAHVLRPAPLTGEAIAALIAAELGAPGEDGFIQACGEATGGNPFLLLELLRELAADEIVPTAGQAPLVRQLAPPTVSRAVLLRLARLGDDAAALAAAVAVLGDGAPLRRAAALAGLDVEHAGEVAAALARAQILTSERPLAFVHPILRSAVYADLEGGARSRAHRRAATLLAEEGASAEVLATHLLATEPAGDAVVARTLREAAARADRKSTRLNSSH